MIYHLTIVVFFGRMEQMRNMLFGLWAKPELVIYRENKQIKEKLIPAFANP